MSQEWKFGWSETGATCPMVRDGEQRIVLGGPTIGPFETDVEDCDGKSAGY